MSAWVGFLVVVLAGMMQGTYFLGLKVVKPWKWENIWLVFSGLALLIIPVSLAVATVPHLGELFAETPGGNLWRIFLYGAGWGIGGVLAGLGVARMGMALGVSVLIGVCAAVGSFVPMLVSTPDIIFEKKGLMVIAAVLTLLVGVALVAVAGKQRDLSQAGSEAGTQEGSFGVGLVICVFSGIFSAMLNFAIAFSQPLTQAATRLGISESRALYPVWVIALGGGFIANGVYTGYLLTRNRTWGNFTLPRTSLLWLVGAGMALLWTGGMIFYGWGATAMGRLGAVIGWPLYMGVVILGSSLWGFATGEWKGSSPKAKQWMVLGLVVLLVASALLGVANKL